MWRNGKKMKDSFSWLTPKQAGELAGYTARHIQNMITSGKLSATKEDGKYYIDKSEFFRLYPKAHKKEHQGNSALQLSEQQRLELENTMLKDSTSQKEKEIEFLRNQIEFISQEKTKMLDVIGSTTRLLEYKNEKSVPDCSAEKKKNWRDFFKLKKQ